MTEREHHLRVGARLSPWITEPREAAEWVQRATTSYLLAMLNEACRPRDYMNHDAREWELTRPHREAVVAEIDRRFP